MQKIIVSVINDLSTDQRVDKVCNSLLKMGYEVLLVGRKYKNSLPILKPYKTKRLKLVFNSGFLFYAEYNFRLFFFLLFSKKDILLANDLDTLMSNFLVSKIQQKKIVYDSHELFTEIPELINRQKIKNIWLIIERWIFPKLKNVYTVNHSIAKFYSKKYGVNVKYIKNFPYYKNIEIVDPAFNSKGKKIIIYQGAINIGRGIELLIETIKSLDNYMLLIVGDGDIIQQLKSTVKAQKLENKVIFLGRINPDMLRKITPVAEIGFSVEENLGLNYHYALPNKIFDYIQAEIPIIVSDLPEMKQIVLNYKVGEILEKRTPEELVKLIKKVESKNYSVALKAAKKELTWESEEQKLFKIFKNLK